MTSGDIERWVLNTLIGQTNEPQGKWTSERSLRTVCAANGGLTTDKTLTALAALTDDNLDETDSERYPPADGVERVLHPGEALKNSVEWLAIPQLRSPTTPGPLMLSGFPRW
jgi:hypothetical protein